jgi:hypothetical protein
MKDLVSEDITSCLSRPWLLMTLASMAPVRDPRGEPADSKVAMDTRPYDIVAAKCRLLQDQVISCQFLSPPSF